MSCPGGTVCNPVSCVNGVCVSAPLNCNDGINCTKDSCDSVKGCINAPDHIYCDTPDPCQNFTCSTTKGCVATNVTCESTGYFCLYSTCVSYQGCANQSYVCPTNNDTCTFTGCVEDKNKHCKEDKLNCVGIVDTAVIALTTAAVSAALIAGIIAAVVIFCGVAGGATFAFYSKMDDSGMANVQNNPLFVDNGSSGTNPLAKH
jgi:hypothetical protein